LQTGGEQSVDPRTGQPTFTQFDPGRQQALEGRLRAAEASLNNPRVQQQRQAEMNRLVQARRQQVEAINTRLKAMGAQRETELQEQAGTQTARAREATTRVRADAKFQARRLETFAKSDPANFTTKGARDTFFTMVSALPNSATAKANQMAQQGVPFVQVREFLLDQELSI